MFVMYIWYVASLCELIYKILLDNAFSEYFWYINSINAPQFA